MGSLQGRVAIVTGAGGGLGRSYALALAGAGASVVVNDVAAAGTGSESPAERVVAEIRAAGGLALASCHDVADWVAAGHMVESAVHVFGGLDVLVNNAGIARPTTIVEQQESDWDQVIRVHLKGHAAASHHAMVHWSRRADRRDVSIIHTTSVAALAWSPRAAAYASAKAGILALSRSISREGSILGVRSNVISPVARTPMSTRSASQRGVAGATDDPFHPDLVARAVVWLAGSDCTANDQVVHVVGRRVMLVGPMRIAHEAVSEAWTSQQLQQEFGPHFTSAMSPDELLTEPGGRRF